MLSDTFNSLIERDLTTVKQLRYLGHLPKSTMYDLLNDETKESRMEVAIKGWLSPSSPEAVREATLRELTNGQASFAQPDSEPNLDLNNDGVVNLGDALSGCVGAMASVQSTLSAVHKNFERDPDSITVAVQDILHAEVVVATKFLEIVDRICTQQVSRRCKAKE